MRIAIDARPLHWPGIGRYTRELVTHLVQMDAENEYYIWVNTGCWEKIFPSIPQRFRLVEFRSKVHSLGEQMEMSWRLVRDRIDVLHCPSSLVVPFWVPCAMVLTVHDMLFKSRPDSISGLVAQAYFKIIHHRGIRQAKRIITVSEFTRRELVKHHSQTADLTRTVYNGISPAFAKGVKRGSDNKIHATLGVQCDYFITVGALKKHKNFNRLVRAYACLPDTIRSAFSLVIVTRSDLRNPDLSLYEVLRELNLGDQVIVVSGLSDRELALAYSGARAFISVALYEGFGLPIVEAMACGTAVIASNIPVFNEVAGDAATFVDPEDEQSIAEALERAAVDDALVNTLQTKGLARSRQFTWTQTARDTLATYISTV